jgi:hypothetical protein
MKKTLLITITLLLTTAVTAQIDMVSLDEFFTKNSVIR